MPDIMTVGKGIGGGFPLSARDLHRDASPPPSPGRIRAHSSSSYGGNPLASAAGLAALEIILGGGSRHERRAGGPRHARPARGDEGEVPRVGEVRGKGLLLGMELVRDRKTKEPVGQGGHAGALSGVPAPRARRHDVHPPIRINPPLVITEDDGAGGARHPRRGPRSRSSRARAPVADATRGAHRLRQRRPARPPARLAAPDDVELVAVADVRPERRAAAAAQLPGAERYAPRRPSSRGRRSTSWTSARRPLEPRRPRRIRAGAGNPRPLREAAGRLARRAAPTAQPGRGPSPRRPHRAQLASRAHRPPDAGVARRWRGGRHHRRRLAYPAHRARCRRAPTRGNWRVDPAVAGGGVLTRPRLARGLHHPAVDRDAAPGRQRLAGDAPPPARSPWRTRRASR